MAYLEKLKEFYDIRANDDDFSDDKGFRIKMLRKNEPEGEWKRIPLTEKEGVFLCGKESQDDEGVVKVSLTKIYEEFFDWDEETWSMQLNGYGLRTKKYFDAIKKDIGFEEIVHGWDTEEFETSSEYPYFGAIKTVEIGKTKENRWCAELGYQTAIDDYNEEKIYFNRKPSVADVKTLRKIEKIRMDIRFRIKKEIFRCYECGREIHWLDVEGGLDDKIFGLEERFCGFCDNP